jgi:hypothetical protein
MQINAFRFIIIENTTAPAFDIKMLLLYLYIHYAKLHLPYPALVLPAS